MLTARMPVSLPPNPLRRPLSSVAQGDQPPKSLEEKVDQMQQRMEEIDQQFGQNLMEVLKWYKNALEASDHGYFEKFLVNCHIMKEGKYGDGFIWRCELATFFVLSATVGYLLACVTN